MAKKVMYKKKRFKFILCVDSTLYIKSKLTISLKVDYIIRYELLRFDNSTYVPSSTNVQVDADNVNTFIKIKTHVKIFVVPVPVRAVVKTRWVVPCSVNPP